jgi:hypothetical protein
MNFFLRWADEWGTGEKWIPYWRIRDGNSQAKSRNGYESERRRRQVTRGLVFLPLRLVLYPNGSKRASIWTSLPRSTIYYVQNDFWGYDTFSANQAMIHLAQIVHLSCTETYTVSKRNETSFHLSLVNPGVPSGASKIISDHMAHLAQTVHLSCTKTNTISKRTERRFYRTHTT